MCEKVRYPEAGSLFRAHLAASALTYYANGAIKLRNSSQSLFHFFPNSQRYPVCSTAQ